MGAFFISLVLTPVFAEPGVAPKLQLTLSVEEATTFEAPVDDACFLARWLELGLKDPAGAALKPVACTQPRKVTTVAVTPQQPYTRTFSLAALVPSARWQAGRWSFEGDWRGPMQQQSISGTEFVRARALGEVTVKRGEAVTLPGGGGTLRFTSHGHKHTYPGQRSPLLVAASLNGKDVTASVDTEARVFRLGAQTFELVASDYDVSMTLRCFGDVALP